MPSWFDLHEIPVTADSPNDESGVLKAVRNVHAMIDKEVAAGTDPDNIFVCGFSQGGALTLASVLLYPRALGGGAVFSGWVPFNSSIIEQISPDAKKEMSLGTGSLGSTSGTPMEEDDHAPLWCYVTKLKKMGEGGGNTRFKCNYCQHEYKGSYFRVKAHLLKLSGNGIRVCPKVTPQHLAEMQRKIEDAKKRLKMAMPKKVPLPPSTQSTSTGSGALDTGGFRIEGYEPRKRKATGTSALEKAFNPVIREQLHSEIARMFYSAGLPFHLSRNPY